MEEVLKTKANAKVGIKAIWKVLAMDLSSVMPKIILQGDGS